METRRDFLKLAGLAAASSFCSALCPSCGILSASSSGDSGTAWNLRAIESLAGTDGARGWAAWQGGRRVAGSNLSQRAPSLSITKSIAALAASRAAKEGWLSPTELVSGTIPEWRLDPYKSRITVRMLLQQVSGLEAGVIPLYRNHPADKGRAAVGLRCTDVPGTVFRYGPGHWETLAEVMKRKLALRGSQSLSSFMASAVMNPVGLSHYNWRSDRLGTPYFSTGTELDITELGRLGRTIGTLLDGHDSNGISSSDFLAMTLPSAVNPMFGGGLWRNSNAARPGAGTITVEHSIDAPLSPSYWNRACLSTRQPSSLVALIGSGGKRVYIWPAADRRITRIGSSTSWNDSSFLSAIAAPAF